MKFNLPFAIWFDGEASICDINTIGICKKCKIVYLFFDTSLCFGRETSICNINTIRVCTKRKTIIKFYLNASLYMKHMHKCMLSRS